LSRNHNKTETSIVRIAGAGSKALRSVAARASAVFTALLLATAGPGGIAAAEPAAGEGTARARFLMGTTLSIESDAPLSAQVFEDAFSEVARLEAILSNWRATSEISRLNEVAARAPVRCSSDLFDAIRTALRWAETTGGAFDPTVEPLVVALGLRGEDGRMPGTDAARSALEEPPPLEPDPVAALARGDAGAGRLAIGWRHVRLRRPSRLVSFDVPGVGLDLGGIAKGMALDAAAGVLRRHGVRRALLDFGGQILAIGRPAGVAGWAVGIADPDDRDRAIAMIGIADLSVATSANSERSVETPRGRVGHILDPVAQRPARFVGSVTVASRDATSADALSTALFVMGPEEGAAWADTREIPALYLWRDAEGALHRRATRQFEERFESRPDASGN
jgi:thiamine biosynthesis lipoprotein